MPRAIIHLLPRYLAAAALIPISILSGGVMFVLFPLFLVLAVLMIPIWVPLYFLNFRLADRIADFFLMPLSIAYGVSMWSGVSLMRLFRISTEVTEEGIRTVRVGWNGTPRLITWQEIEAIERRFTPPFWSYRLRLRDGTHCSIDIFLDPTLVDELLERAAAQGITYEDSCPPTLTRRINSPRKR